MRVISVVRNVFLLSALVQAVPDPQSRDNEDLSKLVGSYVITEGEKSGEKIPAERLKDIVVRFTTDMVTTIDKDEKEVYAATYTLETDRKPWKISMKATITPTKEKDARSTGLLAIDGKAVKLIYSLPNGTPPESFKTEKNQQMFVLRKMEKKAE